MKRMGLVSAALVPTTLAIASPAGAEVKATTAQGFEVVETVSIDAPPAKIYQAITQPSRWWQPQHTFSGSAANLSLDPKAGGCFCETLKDGGRCSTWW